MGVGNGASIVINSRNSCEEDRAGGNKIYSWCPSYVEGEIIY